MLVEPRELFERAGPASADFIFGNIVAVVSDSTTHARDLTPSRIEEHIDHPHFKTALLRALDQSAVFARRKYRLDADDLIDVERNVKPVFDAFDGVQICRPEIEPLLRKDVGSQQIGIDDPDRAIPSGDVGLAIQRTLAAAVRPSDNPEDWPFCPIGGNRPNPSASCVRPESGGRSSETPPAVPAKNPDCRLERFSSGSWSRRVRGRSWSANRSVESQPCLPSSSPCARYSRWLRPVQTDRAIPDQSPTIRSAAAATRSTPAHCRGVIARFLLPPGQTPDFGVRRAFDDLGEVRVEPRLQHRREHRPDERV